MTTTMVPAEPRTVLFVSAKQSVINRHYRKINVKYGMNARKHARIYRGDRG